MKLRKTIRGRDGQSQPEIEALVEGRWIALSLVNDLDAIAAGCHVSGDLTSDMISVLALGKNGWDQLSKALVEVKNKDLREDETKIITTKPFVPASFREFSLYEQHFVNVARQHVKRYMPALYPVSKLYEHLSKKRFPLFNPSKLWYKQPLYYYGSHLNFYGNGERVEWPSYIDDLDYELELAAIINKEVKDLSITNANQAIGGFILMNDLSGRGHMQRDEMGSGNGPQKSKHFANSMADIVVTADEVLGKENNLKGTVRINGRTVANCNTAGMQFSFAEIIAFVSKSQTLYPGEILAGGALPMSSGLENGHFIKPNDVLQFELEQLGTLENVFCEKH